MSFSAEDSLLSVLLSSNESYWRVAGIVIPEDFSPRGQRVYAAIADAVKVGEKADFITIGNKHGEELGNEAMQIACNVAVSVSHVESYAKLLSEAGEAKRVRDAGKRITAARSFAEAQELLAAARPQQAQRVKSVKDGLSEMLEAMQLRASGPFGLSWGIPEVDAIAGRLVGSRVYGIAGRAKMGKTTLSLAPQLAAVLSNRRVLNFSLEMTAGDLTTRALASVGQFSHDVFEREDGVPDEMWPQINLAARQLVEKGWLIDDQPALTMDQIEARSIQHHMESPLDLIVVDHIGLVKLPGRGTRNDELGGVTYGLKNLSKRINVPVLALIQLNRSLESRDDKRPKMPDLRDSGNIEQDFDLICGIYRDEVYNPGSMDAGHAEIITMATRHTKGGTAFVRAHMETMTYGPAERARRCFPSVGHGKAGSGSTGSGFAGYGAKGGKQSALSVVGRDD